MKKLRVIITGGGTGGHIYPLLAVVSELRALSLRTNIDLRVKYLGSAGIFRNVLETNKIEVIHIPKFIGFIKSLWIMFWFMPNALFSTGGSRSVGVVLASRFYFIPVVTHELDTIPVPSNRISNKFAKTVTLGFSSAIKYFNRKGVYTGTPVRPDIFQDNEKTEEFSKKFMAFSAEKPLIFVISEPEYGDAWINNLIVNNLPGLLQFTQVLHQTGKDSYESLLPRVNEIMKIVPIGLREGYLPISHFKENIHLAYKAADLVISRPESEYISETSALGRPSLLLPLPESVNYYQIFNAKEYAEKGGGAVLEYINLPPGFFLEMVKDLLSHPEELKKMSDAAYTFYKKDAAMNIAEILLRVSKIRIPTNI